MRVRVAMKEDASAVVELRLALWPDAPRQEHERDVELILDHAPRSTLPLKIFVAEIADRMVGFIEVGMRSHADGCDPSTPAGYIEGWYVVAEHTGQGVGRALLETAEKWLGQIGCVEVGSDTWADNADSIAAHEALGFEKVDTCVNFRKAVPAHHAPAALTTPNDHVAAALPVTPERLGLLQWLCDHVTTQDLTTIAEADAGMDAADNLKALHHIVSERDFGAKPDVGESWLQEVCSLTMWTPPDDNQRPASHRQRAFACCILLLGGANGAAWDGHTIEASDVVPALTDSVLALADEDSSVVTLATQFLAYCETAWHSPHVTDSGTAFFGAGLAVLLAFSTRRLIDQLLAVEQRTLEEGVFPSDNYPTEWLVRASGFDQHRNVWRSLFDRLLDGQDNSPIDAWRKLLDAASDGGSFENGPNAR